MAPHSKQNQKEPSVPRANQTLHKYFGSKPLVSTKPKGKNTASMTRQEVIIIDSDSDDEPEIVQTISNKRRKLSPKNVDNPTFPRIKVESSATLSSVACHSKENAREISDKPAHNDSPDTPGSFGKEGSSCFGNPFLLLNERFPEKNQEDPPSSFGKPFLLASLKAGTPSSDTKALVASGSNMKAALSSEDIAVDIDLTLDDWDDGGDERPPESKLEDDPDIEWVSLGGLSAKTTTKSEEQSVCNKPPENISDINAKPLFPSKSIQSTTEFASTRLISFEAHTPNTSNTSASTRGPSDKRGGGNNAFTHIMSSLKEAEIWNEAMVAREETSRPQKGQGNRRKAPFYKVLQGMPIAVDAFNYGKIPEVTAYFLTHAHSDHYTNLSSTWKNGPIYCSQGTANLIIHKLSVDKKWVHPLPMDTPTPVPDTNGVLVTLIEANHCPGSCLFFFEGRQTVNAGDSTFKSSHVGSSRVFRYLHCGDFRASPRHVLHPAVQGKNIDNVYLDTTYLDPKYTFPPQPLVINACAELARRIISGNNTIQNKSSVISWMSSSDKSGKGKEKEKEKEKTKPLIAIGTYSIGKERIAKAVALALNTKIYCDARKTDILKCQDDPELHRLLTSNPHEGFVHLVPLSSITTDHLKTYLERFRGFYGRIIGFRPTGWTYTQAVGTNQSPSISSVLAASPAQNYSFADLELSSKSTPSLSLYPVPYSEHSSFYELTCFAMSFNWTKMIATVNVGSETSRGKMSKWIAKWEAERKKRGRDTIVPYSNPDYW